MTTMQNAVKERPILFSGPMVSAILEGRKTQTRRVVKPQADWMQPEEGSAVSPEGWQTAGHSGWWSEGGDPESDVRKCPLGVPGDRIWVKETTIIAPKRFATPDDSCIPDADGDPRFIQYLASHPDTEGAENYSLKKTPSIFMPRWASRITLEITNVRVERLQDISEADAIAEGAADEGPCDHIRQSCEHIGCCGPGHRGGYHLLWDSINGKGSWDLNPWVWVYDFKVLPRESLVPTGAESGEL